MLDAVFAWNDRGPMLMDRGHSDGRYASTTHGQRMKVLIPISPERLGGPYIEVGADDFRVLGQRGRALLVEFHSLPEGIRWFREFEIMYCQQRHDPESIKVVRVGTEADRREMRVPLWIQGEEIPECCGRKMHFVGQIDDDNLCCEAPEGAKYWWHDAASFYVFTCAQCLKCEAIGQQF